MAWLVNTDRDVQAATEWALKAGQGGTRGLARTSRVDRGVQKILSQFPAAPDGSPSYTLMDFLTEAKGREEATTGMNQLQQRVQSYGALSVALEKFGKQLQVAKAALGKDAESAPRWQQIQKYIAQNYTGDPRWGGLVAAALEYGRQQARLTAGAGLSQAQINVSAQDAVNEVINPVMKGSTIAEVLKQTALGAKNEVEAYGDTIRATRDALRKPWGGFRSEDTVPKLGAPEAPVDHGVPELGATFHGEKVLRVTKKKK